MSRRGSAARQQPRQQQMMPPCLHRLSQHLQAAAATPNLTTSSSGAREQQRQTTRQTTTPLSARQLQSFIRDGFLLLPTVVSEMPPGFCERFYEKAYQHRNAPRDQLWGELTDEVNAVLAGPTCKGALTSLLGADFLMPPGNSHMHVSFDGDQVFHKDGTDHGPTQATVRDHRPRHILALFYPRETTLDMGPTCVLPGTQYPALDREGAHTSEQHLQRPRPATDNASPPPALPPPHVKGPEDVRRIEDARSLLGDPTLQEHKLLVPAGSMVLCHLDLFHRASRRRTTSAASSGEKEPVAPPPWRPMMGIRNAVRVSDPLPCSVDLFAKEIASSFVGDGSGHAQAVWREMYRYQLGAAAEGTLRMASEPVAAVATGGGASVGLLLECVVESECEMERLGAAYTLGRVASDDAVAELARLLVHPLERVRRAAAYGISVGGAAAIPYVLALLKESRYPLPPRTATDSYGDMAQHGTVMALHSVAQLACVTAAARTPSVVSTVVACMQRAAADISAFTSAADPGLLAELEPLIGNNYHPDIQRYLHVTERRRTLAEGLAALGHIGALAIRQGDAAVGLACAEGILPWASSATEPGVAFPSFMTRNTVQHNAGTALVRLCSDPELSRAAVPALHGAEDAGGELMPSAQFGLKVLSGMVAEARTRLALLCEEGAEWREGRRKNTRLARLKLRRRLDQVVWPSAFAATTEYLVI